MRRILGILAFVLVAGFVVFRVVNWGAEVKDYVDTEQQKKLVRLSNSVVNPLNAATQSVEVQHDLLRRASDPTEEKHKGLVHLLEISGGTVPERIAKARVSIQTLDLPQGDEAKELLDETNALLNVYEGFVPVHTELAKKILASSNFSPELAAEVDQKLVDLEVQKNDAIEAFTKAQEKFLH
jgi:hypothetical protein